MLTSYLVRGLIYVIVGVLFGISEHAWTSLFEAACEGTPSPTAAAVTKRAYIYLTTFDRRKPENLHTSVVILRDDPEPKEVMNDFCQHRDFVRRLIEEIQTHDPLSIVVDNYISADLCPADRDFETALINAQVPIILGLHTLKKDEVERLLNRPLTPAELKSFGRACQALFDNRLLPSAASRVHHGLLRFNADTKKLPLSWPVFPDPYHISDRDQPVRKNTLASEAAATVPARAVAILDAHPYTDLMPKGKFLTTSGVQALCAQYQPGDDWRKCPSPGATFDDRFRHRVVVIGDDKDQELTPTLAGTMPGVYLHANYIEALTDDRYFKPVSQLWQIVGGVLLIAIFEAAYFIPVFLARSNSASLFKRMRFLIPVVGLSFSLAVMVIVWITCVLLAILTGTLALFWFPGAVALLLRFGEGIRESIMGET